MGTRSFSFNWPVIALLLIAAAAFLPSLTFGFINLDDPPYVVDNPYLEITWENIRYWCRNPAVGIYMPLTMFSYMVDHLIWGKNPLGYHLQSLLWHLLAVWLVYRCFRLGGLRLELAWLGALLFAIHPQRVESVVWVSERKDVMCAAFYFWAIHAYMSAKDPERFNWKAWVLLILALLSKSMAVSLPVIFFLIDYMRRERVEPLRWLRKFTPYIIPVAVICLITFTSQIHSERPPHDWPHQFAVAARNLGWYTLKLFLPLNLNPYYPRIDFSVGLSDGVLLLAGICLLLIPLAAGFYYGKRFLLFRVLPTMAMPLVIILPVAGIIHIGEIDYADRYSYIPAAFLIFGLLYLLQQRFPAMRQQRVIMAILGTGCVILAFSTVKYMFAWKSHDSYWQAATRGEPVNRYALIMRIFSEFAVSNYPEAAKLIGRLKNPDCVEENFEPGSGEFYTRVLTGDMYYRHGQFVVAKKLISEAYPAKKPKYLDQAVLKCIMHRMITMSMFAGDYAAAKRHIRHFFAKKLNDGKDYDYHIYHGLYAALSLRNKEAEKYFLEALRLRPDDPATLQYLAKVRSTPPK